MKLYKILTRSDMCTFILKSKGGALGRVVTARYRY